MAECPKCGSSLPDDFGMVTCKSCGAMVFLDMDGQAQVAGEEPAPDGEDFSFEGEPAASSQYTSTPLESPIEFDEPPASLDSLVEEPEIFEEVQYNGPVESFEPEQTFDSEQSIEPEPIFNPSTEENSLAESEMSEFLLDEALLSQDETVPPLEEYSDPIQDEAIAAIDESDAVDLSDIAEYGNSELSQAREGVIYYDLIIEGIDTKNLRNEVKEALEDIRFNWEVSQILNGIRNGVLRIDMLAPPKAVLIVKALRGLPLQLSWEQRLLSQTEMVGLMPDNHQNEAEYPDEATENSEGVDNNEEDYF